MENEKTLSQLKVIANVSMRLTDLFEDWLAENIGEDILAEYEDGFTVEQVATDLNEAIKKWATEKSNLEALTELVTEYADEYLHEDDDF